MSATLPQAVEALLRRHLDEGGAGDDPPRPSPRVVATHAVGGGSISRAERYTLADGRAVFVKSNPRPLPQIFDREVAGLRALAAVGALRVPHAYGVGEDPLPFIVLEAIDTGRPGPRFSEDLGHGLATLHRRSAERHATASGRFGFPEDNYIGATPQPNLWCDDWVDFFSRHRLGYQLDLARQRGFSGELSRLGDRLLARLDTLIADPPEPACLLHGDLWGGNYLCDSEGAPVLIDPATYYGRREADLAMTTLFGGFDRRFYDAYEETWPLAPGSDERLEIYTLYHLLNHLNLFGGGYLGSCLSVLRRFT